MIMSLTIALVGAVLTAAGGCLLGVQLGRRARRRLVQRGEEQARRIEQLEAHREQQWRRLDAVEGLCEDVRSMLDGSRDRDLHEQLRRLADGMSAARRDDAQTEDLRRELHRALAPVLEHARAGQGRHESLLEAVEPLLVHKRRAQSLEGLPALSGGRRQLPRLLDRVAQRGGFTRVLLSDEVGLPIAASQQARDADATAGLSSLIFTLADRVSQTGGPRPVSVLVRDTAGQLTLHRIFGVGDERYLVTAVSRGAEVSADALDPALAALEGSLAPRSGETSAPPLCA